MVNISFEDKDEQALVELNLESEKKNTLFEIENIPGSTELIP